MVVSPFRSRIRGLALLPVWVRKTVLLEVGLHRRHPEVIDFGLPTALSVFNDVIGDGQAPALFGRQYIRLRFLLIEFPGPSEHLVLPFFLDDLLELDQLDCRVLPLLLGGLGGDIRGHLQVLLLVKRQLLFLLNRGRVRNHSCGHLRGLNC